jgi:glycerate-2-kinase
VPDRSTFADAARIIERYKLKREIPASVVAYIERGVAGIVRETPENGDVCFLKSRNMIIGGIAQALFAARSRAKSLGYNSELVTSEVQGQAREAGRVLAQNALNVQGELKPGERRCLLFGGETTVSVNGNGKGGRNQELALTFAREISGTYGITLLSASTDGADGPTDAAGALVDGTTVQTARQCRISPEAYLDNNDSYTFFQKIDFISHARHHIKTGLTGTNVMDMQIILLEG